MDENNLVVDTLRNNNLCIVDPNSNDMIDKRIKATAEFGKLSDATKIAILPEVIDHMVILSENCKEGLECLTNLHEEVDVLKEEIRVKDEYIRQTGVVDHELLKTIKEHRKNLNKGTQQERHAKAIAYARRKRNECAEYNKSVKW